MNIRERSSSLGWKLAQFQKTEAWPNATTEDMTFVISDAIANLMIYAQNDLGVDMYEVADRALMHAMAEMGEEGEMPA